MHPLTKRIGCAQGELGEKLRTRRKLRRHIDVEDAQELIEVVRQAAVILPTITEAIPPVVRDARDDYLIAQALLGGADVLISRDKDVLALAQVEQVRMLGPFQFVRLYLGDEAHREGRFVSSAGGLQARRDPVDAVVDGLQQGGALIRWGAVGEGAVAA